MEEPVEVSKRATFETYDEREGKEPVHSQSKESQENAEAENRRMDENRASDMKQRTKFSLNWVEFWKLMKKSKATAQPLYRKDDYFFEGTTDTIFFYKLGQNPTEHLPATLAKICNKMPLLKRKFKAKWQQRYGCIINDLLVYFRHDGANAIALGCISLAGGTLGDIVEDKDNQIYYMDLTTKEPRRPKKKVYDWRVGAKTFEECENLRGEIEKYLGAKSTRVTVSS